MSAYEDRYSYPGTHTFINNFGVRDPDKLAELEAELTAAAVDDLPDIWPVSDAGLKAIHRGLFGAIYPWAGQYRAETLTKVGEEPGQDVRFAEGPLVTSQMAGFFKSLSADVANGNLKGIDQRTFSYRAAVYMAELNAIHPFPDGNGRVQRIFLAELAGRGGFELDHAKLTRETWIPAAVDARRTSLYNQN